MAKKSIEETYGLDVANYVKQQENKQFEEQQAINKRKEPQKDFGLPIADQKAKEQYAQAKRIAPRSFSSHEDVMKSHQYMGEIDLGNGNYWTILKGQDGFVATSPTNTGMIFNSSYFENIEDLYEELQQQGDFLQEKKGK